MSDYPILVAHEMLKLGCQRELAMEVKEAMESRPEDDTTVLWLRLQGRTYREIGDMMGFSRTHVWRIINQSLRNTVYSIIERAVVCSA